MSRITLIDYLAEESGMTPYWVFQSLVHGRGMMFKTEQYWNLVRSILKRDLAPGELEKAAAEWAEANPDKAERSAQYDTF